MTTNLVEIEIDGEKIEAPVGSMLITAAQKLGKVIPHFCYHKHLSIAANCRMCLVEIEKAPKPMPACATPVTAGMVVRTQSEKTKQAQQSVMEFLLINHPLDCPICDQGGECQLQDLAVGYGASQSHYQEEKRVVMFKSLGPLISAQEMSRCIHCTRCVRFGQELAGAMELGMAYRGEHSEIMSFLGSQIESELSGNMIDVCPVGALTSKPFRYQARTWELAKRKTISPHDGLAPAVIAQVKQNDVLRVLPFEDESLNDCWLSDKDRFSYEATTSEQRLTSPQIKRDGQWHNVSWEEALKEAAVRIKKAASSVAALASPHATNEELYLLKSLLLAVQSKRLNCLPRQTDFEWHRSKRGANWLGMEVAEFNQLKQVFVIGSFLRKDHPLLALRLRKATQKGLKLQRLSSVKDDWAMPSGAIQTELIKHPLAWIDVLAQIAAALGVDLPETYRPQTLSTEAQQIAQALNSDIPRVILLGNMVEQHPEAGIIVDCIQKIAAKCGCQFGFLTEAVNSVGAQLFSRGSDSEAVFTEANQAYITHNIDVELDCADGAHAVHQLQQAQSVICLAQFATEAARQYAHVLLPITPFTENSGSYFNCEGNLRVFSAVTQPHHLARPAWKVLRVLANLLEFEGFAFDDVKQVRTAALASVNLATALDNSTDLSNLIKRKSQGATQGLYRVADVPIYFADHLVRRAHSLQQTLSAKPPHVQVSKKTWTELDLKENDQVEVKQGQGRVTLPVTLNLSLPDDVVWLSAAHASVADLGAMFGAITINKLKTS